MTLLLVLFRPTPIYKGFIQAHFNPPATRTTAVTATGIIWSRYSFVITPVNYNLFSVNAFMAVTGSYQLWRKFTAPATPAAPPAAASS